MTIEPQVLEALKQLVGPKTVLTSEDEIENHSYDTWPVAFKWRLQGKQPYRPDAVCRITHEGQVCSILAWASEHGVPVTPWGLGSSVTGAPLPTEGGIVLDMSEMRKVLALDETDLLVKVQAGKLGIELERELNEMGYTLHHSPQSLDRSSVGGWVSTRATGQFSSRWGGIEELVVAFSVALPTGELIETNFVPRAAVGPDLRHVFMGAEGTMGVVTDVTLKIFPLPEYQVFEAITFDGVEAGLEVMRKFMAIGLRPFLVRFYDVDEARHAMQDRSFDKCVMFLGFEGIEGVAKAEYAATIDICKAHGGELIGPAAVEAWMDRRFDFSTVENLLNEPGGLAETIEIAHFWSGIGEVYYALKEALRPYAAEVLGHFSHVYPQGSSLYVILLGHTEDDASAEETILKIWQVAMDICIEKGATVSHHHGVGLARAGYVHKDLGSSFIVLERMKKAMDPANIMNPGKLDLKL